jgi:hypothetical protein
MIEDVVVQIYFERIRKGEEKQGRVNLGGGCSSSSSEDRIITETGRCR